MISIAKELEKEFHLREDQVVNVLSLFESGATIPFIARYRKEMTGTLDEIVLRNLKDRLDYLKEIEERKVTVLKTIESQGKLTDELKSTIEACLEKAKLEDLYLPFKPKRKTRATTARDKGLEPLYLWIVGQKDPGAVLAEEAAKYISEEKGVKSAQDALSGAADIFAEQIAETAEYREFVRSRFLETGFFVSKVRKEHEGKKTKFEMYYDYRSRIKDIPSHNMLAIRRGEKEEILNYEIETDEVAIVNHITEKAITIPEGPVRDFLAGAVKDGFERLMKLSLSAEVRVTKKEDADLEAIKNFEVNLRELLLTPPAGQVRVLALDPGFRTGCKLVALDETGKFLYKDVIFPHEPQKDEVRAAETLLRMIQKYTPDYIVIGNGTASRESERFIKEAFKKLALEKKPGVLLVSEAGASVYSASEVAGKEFPDLDLTLRSAISIGRRFQDPLSELVKIEPRSIGVGQYQHDVDQTLLKKKLDEVTESCVNFVGVELNTASAELLSYVSGLNKTIAENIVKHRNKNGVFRSRQELLAVARLGEKAFEQCAGFLRIRGAENPLDNSAVHPESYYVVQSIADSLNIAVTGLIGNMEVLNKLKPVAYANEKTGEVTIKDIIDELKKPGRDPRKQFSYASFREDVSEISHLKEGMILEGVITNVANFGAFVDIGVHQDGLVHVSKLADRFIKDPHEAAKVGQIVKVKVVGVDEALKRISLSMRTEDLGQGGPVEKGAPAAPRPASKPSTPPSRGMDPKKAAPSQAQAKKGATLADLIKKFQG